MSERSLETATDKRTERSDPRLLELIGMLSLATDLAMGQPMESGLGTCLVATRLGGTLGLGKDDLRDAYQMVEWETRLQCWPSPSVRAVSSVQARNVSGSARA